MIINGNEECIQLMCSYDSFHDFCRDINKIKGPLENGLLPAYLVKTCSGYPVIYVWDGEDFNWSLLEDLVEKEQTREYLNVKVCGLFSDEDAFRNAEKLEDSGVGYLVQSDLFVFEDDEWVNKGEVDWQSNNLCMLLKTTNPELDRKVERLSFLVETLLEELKDLK